MEFTKILRLSLMYKSECKMWSIRLNQRLPGWSCPWWWRTPWACSPRWRTSGRPDTAWMFPPWASVPPPWSAQTHASPQRNPRPKRIGIYRNLLYDYKGSVFNTCNRILFRLETSYHTFAVFNGFKFCITFLTCVLNNKGIVTQQCWSM